MTIRRASVILPCSSWDEFPTHLGNQASAELLAAWTTLWHPLLLAATEKLPGWHQAEEPPDPASFEGELVLVPPPSRQRMPSDWSDRLRATAPTNPAPVDTFASRSDTVAAVLNAAELNTAVVDADLTANFLALGYAYLQVELLTRAMRYSSVLDTEQFELAVVTAAKAAVADNSDTARNDLTRAFDLLADARNHVYSVDFYVADLTLVADSVMGAPLLTKLARGHATNVLIAGEQIERMAEGNPETFAVLRKVLETGTASIVGGKYSATSLGCEGPEALLADIERGQATAKQQLDHEYEIYGQFDSSYSPLLPGILKGLGFRGALHAAFDGGQLPRADQRKTNWGDRHAASVPALSTTPLDSGQPESWLKLAERISDTIAHDHVATVLLAGWPGGECEYFEDLRRCAQFSSALGKVVTLAEYFRDTREVDEWIKFAPRDYANRTLVNVRPNAISNQVDAYRGEVQSVSRQLAAGLRGVVGLHPSPDDSKISDSKIVINGWNFESNYFIGLDPLAFGDEATAANKGGTSLLPGVLGCGYNAVLPAATPSPAKLAEDLVLRNERLELTVSQKTGGIQSLRLHRDRNTRVSQRLVFHDQRGRETSESQMVAGHVEVTRNDALMGEITSRGRLLDAKGRQLSNYTQRVRLIRGLRPILVDVELDELSQLPQGDLWKSYFGSRIAWAEEALDIRRGVHWGAQIAKRDNIESCEWVEVDDGIGRIVCLSLGLPYHRRAASNRLDTLLIVAGEEKRRFQFAIGLEAAHPTQVAAELLTAGEPYLAELPNAQSAPRGWFLHISAKNAIVTHIEPLGDPASGVRLRILETEGKDVRTKLSAFRPFQTARITDFRGTTLEVLSVSEGAASFDLEPHRWIQIEADWASGDGRESTAEDENE
jgi:alpha-mannosidase